MATLAAYGESDPDSEVKMAADNGYMIRRSICEMVRHGQDLDEIERRLSEESAETDLTYASSLLRVREELLAGKLTFGAK